MITSQGRFSSRFLRFVLAILAGIAALGMAAPASAGGVRIRERGQPGATVQIYLSATLPGSGSGPRHVRLTQANGQPWSLTLGQDGTGTLDFDGPITVRDPSGNTLTIPSSVIQDFEQYYQGIRIGGGPVQSIAPDAVSSLKGAFLGTGPVFGFTPLAGALPMAPGFTAAPDFLSDLNGDGAVTASENIFAAVNLSVWTPFATTIPVGTSFSVVSGISAALPGYYFSLGEITFDESLGFTSATPLSGTVFVVAQHELGTVAPEPSPLALLCVASLPLLAGGLARRRPKR